MVVQAVARAEEGPTRSVPLVQRAQAGDQAAFEALLDGRLPGLLRLALAILGDESDARDAVQQTCVEAWRELPRLREPDRFDAWLGRILTNECRMALRSRRRRRVREVTVSDPDASGLPVVTVAGPGDRSEQLDMLARAFDRLDPDARFLLALHYLEDRSVADIAAMTRLAVTTVKWRLHRARAALAHALVVERR